MTVIELNGRRMTGAGEELRADRWQPTRAGLLNVWRYYDEVFSFHRGRLLLRGANGTGKSKALELLLPFLLDANLQPNRLSTFGGTERTMHWNLMGDGYSGSTRVGYVWLECGRLDDDGRPRWFTCGARLSATVHTRRVHPDYFTTDQRVALPAGLRLVKDGNVPLTRADLASATEGHGVVHDSPATYRRAVRETLLRGMSEDQYVALINAQLKLRTPKLSEHLDPEHLSRLLSEALPPLDEQDLAEIAEGFEKLDRRREDLLHLDQELEAAGRLASKQRQYARRVLRRGAAELISATTQLDNQTREARETRVDHERALADYQAMCDRLGAIDAGRRDAENRIQGHMDSDAYREGRQLDELRKRVRELCDSAANARGSADGRIAESENDEQTANDQRDSAQSANGRMARSRDEAGRMAVQSGLGALFEPLVEAEIDQARREMHALISARERQLAEVREQLAAHEKAIAERDRTDTLLVRRTDELEKRTLMLDDLTRQYDIAFANLQEAVRDWAQASRVIGLADRAEDLADLVNDETAILELVGRATADARELIAREEQRLSAVRTAHRGEYDRLQAEHEALLAHTLFPPASPPHRTANRTTAVGAPLWKLLDWRDDTPEHVRAGVEAALEAAALLDAWVRPDGGIQLADATAGHDSYLAAALSNPAPVQSLASILLPEPGGPVPAAVVSTILDGIAYGPTADGHSAAIGADGTWRLGPAHGSYAKPEATLLGETARERARQRRLAELAAQLDELRSQLEAIDAQLTSLGDRRAALTAELDGRPSHGPLHAAARARDEATLRVAEQAELVHEAEEERTAAEQEAREQLRALSLLASRHALPTARTALNDLADLLRAFRTSADGWLADRDRWQTAEARANEAAARARRSRKIASEAVAYADLEQEKAEGLQARLDAIEAAVDAPYREVLDAVDTLRRTYEELDRERRALEPRREAVNRHIGELKKAASVADDNHQAATAVRDAAAESVMHLGRLGFGRDGQVQLDLAQLATVTAALEAARHLATELDRIGHEQQHVRKAEAELSETMHDVSQYLAGHVDLVMEPDATGDVQVVVATIDGQRIGPAELATRIRAERDVVRTQLTDDERTLFDRTLTGDTRRHVADRIRQADALVRDISTQLEQVRTVSALGVRLVWQVDPDLGPLQRQARDLLLRDPATLVESQREALHDFFRARIDQIRAEGTAGGWQHQLEEVLDYRRWHRFIVQMRQASGEWVAVTRRQHGAKSGGEKAIVLHLPLFAAAAAHYRAAPEGPRLVLLDEVFVGVDSTNRGQLMDVLSAFDLDLMLTSDTEWCTYAELDGIAIHQLLAGGDGDDAVTTARFVWNGQRLDAGESPDV